MVEPLPEANSLASSYTLKLTNEMKFEETIGDCHKFAVIEEKLCADRLKLANEFHDVIGANEKSALRKKMFENVTAHFKRSEEEYKKFVLNFP